MSQTLPAGLPIELAIDRLGVFVDQPLDDVGLVARGEATGNALARQDVRQQRMGGPIELRHRYDVAAAVGQIDQREMHGRLAGGNRERSDTALEFGDPRLEYRRGRIGDPAVAIALGFQIEQGRAMVGAVEGVGNRLVDRNGDGAGGRIGLEAGMDGNGLITHVLIRATEDAARTHCFQCPFQDICIGPPKKGRNKPEN